MGLWFLALYALQGCAVNDRFQAESHCQAVCDKQKEDCVGIDLGDCYDLCTFVVAIQDDRNGCLDKVSKLWECEASADWFCFYETKVVGAKADVSQCVLERTAYYGSGCKPEPLSFD
jgi:hypothetical protein